MRTRKIRMGNHWKSLSKNDKIEALKMVPRVAV